MICACTHRDCYYIFESAAQTPPESCPDCGKHTVRPATPEEIMWYRLECREETKAG